MRIALACLALHFCAAAAPAGAGEDPPPGTTLRFDLASALRANRNLALAPAAPGTSTLFDTRLGFGLRSVTRQDRLTLDLGGTLRLARLPGREHEARIDDRTARLGYRRTGAGARMEVRVETGVSDLRFLDPLAQARLSGSDLAGGTAGQRRFTTARLGFASGIDAPLGLTAEAGARTRRYTGAGEGHYDSRNLRVRLGLRLQLAGGAEARAWLGRIDYRAKDPAGSVERQGRLGVTLAQDLPGALRLELSLGAARQTQATGRRSTAIGGAVLTREAGRGRLSAELRRDLGPNGPRQTLLLSRVIELPEGGLSFRLGASRLGGGATEGLARLDYRQALPTGRFRLRLSGEVASPVLDGGLDVGEELITRADARYRYQVSARDRIDLSALFARTDPALASGAGRQSWATLSATFSRQMTPGWALAAGISHRRSTAAGIAGRDDLVFLRLSRSLTVRP